MSSKENFNKAVFDMFGVGSDPDAKGKANPQPPAVEKAAEPASPAQAAPAAPVSPAPAAPAAPTAPVYTAPRAVTYLAPGTSMEGHLKAKGDIEIAGDFKGDITATGYVTLRSSIAGNITAEKLTMISCSLTGDVHSSGMVTIDAASTITGNIFAEEVLCSGQVAGDLCVGGNATFQKGSRVDGNISTGTMTMERGAYISGSLVMNGESKKSAKPSAQPEADVVSVH